MNGQQEPGAQPTTGRRGSAGRSGRGNTEELQNKLETARQSLTDLGSGLRDRVERKPLQSLAIALGAGYLLGGGLFTRATGRLVFGTLRIGTRLAALPFVRDEIFSAIDALSSERRGQNQDEQETERRDQ